MGISQSKSRSIFTIQTAGSRLKNETMSKENKLTIEAVESEDGEGFELTISCHNLDTKQVLMILLKINDQIMGEFTNTENK